MNVTEEEFVSRLNTNRYKMLKSGYPDYALIDRKTGRLCLVEVKTTDQVKRSKAFGLSENQVEMFYYLGTNGVPCYVWAPDIGLKSLDTIERVCFEEYNKLVKTKNVGLQEPKTIRGFTILFNDMVDKINYTIRKIENMKKESDIPRDSESRCGGCPSYIYRKMFNEVIGALKFIQLRAKQDFPLSDSEEDEDDVLYDRMQKKAEEWEEIV